MNVCDVYCFNESGLLNHYIMLVWLRYVIKSTPKKLKHAKNSKIGYVIVESVDENLQSGRGKPVAKTLM